jgi:MATE family multidrug resistance protein
VFAQAWPIMIGQASIPLVGLVDTVVIGRTGDAVALAAVALGATIMNLIFWSFGFLRMGMTGLTAQAEGASEQDEVNALLLRGLVIGGAIGLALLVLQYPISQLAFAVMAGGPQLTASASDYVLICFFGGPASLGVFAITGWMFGLGKTRHALALQIVMNVTNIVLDVWLVWGLGWGVSGVAMGTMIGQWVALATGLVLASRIAGAQPFALARRIGMPRLFDPAALRRLFAVNRDIMIRTIALLLLFTWFANAGARLGATVLAANHVLMQFVSVAAFIMDAFAFTAESRVGQAIGARSREHFLRAIRVTSEFCLAAGILLALLFWFGGDWAIVTIASDAEVQALASQYLPFAALVPLAGVASWMLDGIFIGATRGKALRNAAIASTALYIVADLLLRPLEALGVWIALLLAYAFRAAALGLAIPSLLNSIEQPTN